MMTPLQMIAEWRKGCSCAGPEWERMFKKPEGSSSPAECSSCTEGLADALEKVLPELELKARLFDLLHKLEDIEWSGKARGPGSGPHSSGGDGDIFPACPVCRGLKEKSPGFIEDAVGHREGCELDRALKEARS